MAGDWIKMRTNLDTDPRVLQIAEDLGLSELQVVGCLWKLWSWADEHTLDGNAVSVTEALLDRFTGVTGFAKSLRKVGWLEGEDRDLSFPRFDEHNGKTAKNRAQTKKRVEKSRNAPSVTKALPEKRREEKSNKHPPNSPPCKKNFRPEDILLPEELATPDFRSAWVGWCEYRRRVRKKPVSEDGAKRQLKKLERVGVTQAIAAIEQSIENDWTGLFPEKVKSHDKRTGRPGPKIGPGQRYEPSEGPKPF